MIEFKKVCKDNTKELKKSNGENIFHNIINQNEA
jgi:hypothetical protein